MGILQHFLMYRDPSKPGLALSSSKGGRGDETADLIAKLIGVNALTVDETENALALIRAAFEKPQGIAPLARDPVQSLRLLQQLANFSDAAELQRHIAETAAYLQTR